MCLGSIWCLEKEQAQLELGNQANPRSRVGLNYVLLSRKMHWPGTVSDKQGCTVMGLTEPESTPEVTADNEVHAETEPDSTNKVIPDEPTNGNKTDRNATTLKRICFSDIDGTLVRVT